MLVGMCAGQPVEIAKPIVKADMISKGQAFSYSCDPHIRAHILLFAELRMF